jgi:hypothetical protein
VKGKYYPEQLSLFMQYQPVVAKDNQYDAQTFGYIQCVISVGNQGAPLNTERVF